MIVAVVAGIAVGLIAPDFGKSVGLLGTVFVSLIKMMIAPVIFCTIVLGIGSVRKAAKVGKVGGLALGYFLVMSTFALAIGLVVGNLIHPGSGLHLADDRRGQGAELAETAHEAGGTTDFLLGIIPTTLFSVADRRRGAADAARRAARRLRAAGDGPRGRADPARHRAPPAAGLPGPRDDHVGWPRSAPSARSPPSSAQTGVDALKSLAVLMVGFYVTCALFVFVVLGTLLKLVAGRQRSSRCCSYLAREFLLILSTSSSESALPRLIAKMEHLGVDRSTVGVVVPTGYSFNLDGTAIYLTMASLFIAEALGDPLSIGEQISLLVFMIIASKGAAGVTGAGLATLAGGLQRTAPTCSTASASSSASTGSCPRPAR